VIPTQSLGHSRLRTQMGNENEIASMDDRNNHKTKGYVNSVQVYILGLVIPMPSFRGILR